MQSLGKVRFRCPVCHADADLDPTYVTCSSCARQYPLRNGAVDFMGPYQRLAHPAAAEIDAVVDRVRAALSLPPEAQEAVCEAVLSSLDRTGIAYIDAEIAALPSRFGAQNFSVPQKTDDAVTKRGKGVTWLWDFGPPMAPAASTIYRSIRFRANAHLAASAVGITYQWIDEAAGITTRLLQQWRRSENPVTALPIDLAPGREFSLPVLIQTPQTPGKWRLSLALSVDGKSVGRPYRSTIAVVAERPSDMRSGHHFADYGLDHEEGVKMLMAHLRHEPGSLLLEVASGANPHLVKLAEAGHSVIASDVCSNQMQIGAIFCHYNMAHLAHNLGYAAFNAFNAPFQPAQFKGVAMFSALHHFPEPASFLKALASLVRPGGFVAALCEPAEPQSVGSEYVRDLEAGINEQVFTVEEYKWIFAQAGLTIHELRNDAGSLKIIALVP